MMIVHNLVGHNLVELLLLVHNLVLNHIHLLLHDHEDHDVGVVHDDGVHEVRDGHVVNEGNDEGPFLVDIDHIDPVVGHKDLVGHSLLAVEHKDLVDHNLLIVGSNFGLDCFGNLNPFIYFGSILIILLF